MLAYERSGYSFERCSERLIVKWQEGRGRSCKRLVQLRVESKKQMAVQTHDQTVRWSVRVSKETDASLRSLLGAEVNRKGALSKFVEDAVRWRVFQSTVRDIKSRNAGMDPDELQRVVDDAFEEVRAERRAKKTR